jgi:hypothetical protein
VRYQVVRSWSGSTSVLQTFSNYTEAMRARDHMRRDQRNGDVHYEIVPIDDPSPRHAGGGTGFWLLVALIGAGYYYYTHKEPQKPVPVAKEKHAHHKAPTPAPSP